MQTKFIKISVILIVLSFLLAGFVFAEDDRSPLDSSYLFYLYYDNGQLFANRDFEFKYDVIPEIYIPETINTQFPYKGEVINLKGEVAKTFQFDPRHGDPKFLKGTLSVKAPYVSDGQKVNFYDGQGNQLLSIFVSESSFCNDDGVCRSEVGEDAKTCPSDCKTVTPVPTTITTEPPAGGGGMLKGIIYLIIGLGMVGGWYGGSAIWRRWKKSRNPIPKPMAEIPIAEGDREKIDKLR